MVFSSFEFLVYFLPGFLLVYYLAPARWKNSCLFAGSLIFYAVGVRNHPFYLALIVCSVLVNYRVGRAIGLAVRKSIRKRWLTVGLVYNFGWLVFFKYLDFILENVNRAGAWMGAGWQIPYLNLVLPIGISFYTFQISSYLIDVYRGKVRAERSVIALGTYLCMFPQLIAGPIVRYADIARELEHREHSWENAAVGLRRFLVGLGKKVILADNFALLIRLFRQSGEKSVLFYWMYAVAFALNIYFDFSGYSDMAIGLGRVLGFHFVENFNYPYLSRSVTEFWRRWHISLGSWFRDYVYIPMGGSRVSRWRWVLNILTVWMLTGLWHGAAWNFVLWGLLFAALLLAEKWIPVLQRLPGVLRHGYVLLAVVLSFVLFNADSLAQAGQDFAGLFGFGSLSLTSAETLYYLKSYAVLFVLGILGSTPVVKNAARRMDGTKAGVVLEAAAMLALLIVCTAYLVDGSFSPFLYFRF